MAETDAPLPLTDCPVLHRDRFLLLVDKPAGVLSHPNPGASAGKAAAAFHGRYDMKARRFSSTAGEVFLIHRLDQDTSGVLLAALSEPTAEKCRAAFDTGTVGKRYLALVAGIPKPDQGNWLDHLAVGKGAGQVRTQVKAGAPANAELSYRVLKTSERHRLALLEINLITGRTHQIRVQAAHRSCPVVGDDVYGYFELNKRLRREHGLRRLFLHAAQLEIKHPASGQQLCVKSPLPAELEEVLTSLGMS